MDNFTLLNALSYAIYICNPKIPTERDRVLYCLDRPKRLTEIKYNQRLAKYIREGIIIRNPDMTYERKSELQLLPEKMPPQLAALFPDDSMTDAYYKAICLLEDLCFFGSSRLSRYLCLKYIQILPGIDHVTLHRLIPSKSTNNIKSVVDRLRDENLITMSDEKERPGLTITKKGSRLINRISGELDKQDMSYLLPLTELLRQKI